MSEKPQKPRLVAWLIRALNLFLMQEYLKHLSYVLSNIIKLLPQHNIHSERFREQMQHYFGVRYESFLKEFSAFLSATYNIPDYNSNVRLTINTRNPTMINEVSANNNSDSFESDIIMLSNSEPAKPPVGFPNPFAYLQPPGPQAGAFQMPPPMFLGPQAGPPPQMPFSMFMQPNAAQMGPSYMPPSMYMQTPEAQAGPPYVPPSMFLGPQAKPSHMAPCMYMQPNQLQGCSHMYHQHFCFPQPPIDYAIGAYPQPVTVPQPDTNWHSGTDGESSEVLFTGYMKPPQERTPEIVDLVGSDSDVTVRNSRPSRPIQPPPVASLIQPILKQHQPHPRGDRDSYSATEWNPPRRGRRQRRQHESDDSTTSATSRSTPERRPRRPAAPLYLHSAASSESSSSENETRVRARSWRRIISATAQTEHRNDKRAHRRDTGSAYRHVTWNVNQQNSDERSTHKTHSNRGVKSNNNIAERGYMASTVITSSSASGAAPGIHKSSSDRRRRHGDSHEMNNRQRNTDRSNSTANYSIISNAGRMQNSDSRPLTHANTPSRSRPRRGTGSSILSDYQPINLTLQQRKLDDTPIDLTLQKHHPKSM